ncbi:MAG: hypothetical protein MUF31_06230 [Akkermansiaceae bacterium]|jgi:hypothetical protein|nr:hypothetical protein [Akkermansiaceae bacterium]
MIEHTNVFDGMAVTLNFPPPKSCIAAIPAHEKWHGLLEVSESMVEAVFSPCGLDGDIRFILNDVHLRFLLDGSGEFRSSHSPEDVMNGVNPFT